MTKKTHQAVLDGNVVIKKEGQAQVNEIIKVEAVNNKENEEDIQRIIGWGLDKLIEPLNFEVLSKKFEDFARANRVKDSLQMDVDSFDKDNNLYAVTSTGLRLTFLLLRYLIMKDKIFGFYYCRGTHTVFFKDPGLHVIKNDDGTYLIMTKEVLRTIDQHMMKFKFPQVEKLPYEKGIACSEAEEREYNAIRKELKES